MEYLVASAQGPVGVAGLVAVIALVVLLGWLAGRRGPRPDVGDVWFAEVPFADGSGSKDRPVLVLAVAGRSCRVATFTSQDKSARRDHAAVPIGVPGLRKASWVDLRPTTVSRRALRRRAGNPGPAFVLWYEQAAAAVPPGRR